MSLYVEMCAVNIGLKDNALRDKRLRLAGEYQHQMQPVPNAQFFKGCT